MNFHQHVEDMLAWYVQLARTPGWKPYAWHQVQQMARECPSLYAELPARLTRAMQEDDNAGDRH